MKNKVYYIHCITQANFTLAMNPIVSSSGKLHLVPLERCLLVLAVVYFSRMCIISHFSSPFPWLIIHAPDYHSIGDQAQDPR